MTFIQASYLILAIIYIVCLIPTVIIFKHMIKEGNNPMGLNKPLLFISIWLIMPVYIIKSIF